MRVKYTILLCALTIVLAGPKKRKFWHYGLRDIFQCFVPGRIEQVGEKSGTAVRGENDTPMRVTQTMSNHVLDVNVISLGIYIVVTTY